MPEHVELTEIGEGIETKAQRLLRQREVTEANLQREVAAARRGDLHVPPEALVPGLQPGVRGATEGITPPPIHLGERTHLVQPDVVGVRIDDDEPQVGGVQELLEQHAGRVRLARARLPAQQRVPVETVGPQLRAHRRLARDDPDRHCRALRRHQRAMRRHVGTRRREELGVDETLPLAVVDESPPRESAEHDAVALRVTHRDRDRRSRPGREVAHVELSQGRLHDLAPMDLAQTRRSVAQTQPHVAARIGRLLQVGGEFEAVAVSRPCGSRDAQTLEQRVAHVCDLTAGRRATRSVTVHGVRPFDGPAARRVPAGPRLGVRARM